MMIFLAWLQERSSIVTVRSAYQLALSPCNQSRCDALYFRIDAVVKCQLGTPLSFTVFEKPIDANGRLMTQEDGGLLFAAMLGVRNLNLVVDADRTRGSHGMGQIQDNQS